MPEDMKAEMTKSKSLQKRMPARGKFGMAHKILKLLSTERHLWALIAVVMCRTKNMYIE